MLVSRFSTNKDAFLSDKAIPGFSGAIIQMNPVNNSLNVCFNLLIYG